MSAKVNATVESEETNTVLRTGIIYFIILLQVSFLVWIINNLVLWSDVSFDFEENPILYILLVPVVMLLFIIPNLKLIVKSKALITISKWISVFALIGQMIPYMLLYVQLNFPEGTLPSGWLSGDMASVLYAILWLVLSLGLVIPGLILELYISKNSDRTFTKSWHMGAILFGIMMMFRFGGTWSAPLYTLFWTVVVIPFLIGLKSPAIDKIYTERFENDKFHQLFFTSAALMTMMFYWITVEPLFSGNTLSSEWVWVSSIIANGVLMIINSSNSERLRKIDWESKRVKFIPLVSYCIFVAMSCLITASSLAVPLMELVLVWMMIGLAAIALFPEILIALKWPKDRLKSFENMRIFVWMLSSIIGIALPMIVGLYDPISSYLGMILLGVNAVFVLPAFIMKKSR